MQANDIAHNGAHGPTLIYFHFTIWRQEIKIGEAGRGAAELMRWLCFRTNIEHPLNSLSQDYSSDNKLECQKYSVMILYISWLP